MRAIGLATILTIGLMPAAQAHHKTGPCSIHWHHAYYEEGRKAPIRDLIRCAARRWPVEGGPSKALQVAACESGQRPDALTPTYIGLYQHIRTSWAARAHRWLWPTWDVGHGGFNARAQAIVSMRMASRFGWSAWGCA